MVFLRDLVRQPNWSPLTNNIAATFVTIAYFRAAIELTGWLRYRFGKSSEYRQILHMIISTLVIFWPLFDPSDWSWRFNVMVPAVMFSRLIYKVSRASHKSKAVWRIVNTSILLIRSGEILSRAPCSKIRTMTTSKISPVLLLHLT
jgi:hypothetical protein